MSATVQTVHEHVAAALAHAGHTDDLVATVATNAALRYLADTLRWLPGHYRPQDVADVIAGQVRQ